MFFQCKYVLGRIVITHCFKKKRDDTPQREKDRARRLEAAYYEYLASERENDQPRST